MSDQTEQNHHPESLSALTVGALGVVFGDIGTSPLYALKESFVGHHPLTVDHAHVFGVLSLIFWTMTLVVTVKYVFMILRADNKGEGGSLALLALLGRKLGESRWSPLIATLGLIAAALFYGDAIITPAISVLSAVEGLTIVNEGLADWVLPISVGILVGLFAIQSRGTAAMGKLFGPIMIIYFLALAVMGLAGIARAPEVLWALSPHFALEFFLIDPVLAFLALMHARLQEGALPTDIFLKSIARAGRVPGTAVFLSANADGIPIGLLHNLKHNHILHERVVFLTMRTEGVPHVAQEKRREVEELGEGFYRIVLRYGFMDEVDIPAELLLEERAGGPFTPMDTSYFLSRQTLIASRRPGMAIWREKLFAGMVRNAESAMESFKLPTNRVIELGSQIEI